LSLSVTLHTPARAQLRTAVTLFSLIATSQRHQVEPLAYLRDVRGRIAATPLSQLPGFLPARWQSASAN
jgi:hypothetical protein